MAKQNDLNKPSAQHTYQINAYDPKDDMMRVKSNQKKWKSDFYGSSLNANQWETVQTGSGQSIAVSGGVLTIATGTTVNAETIIMSKETFTIPVKASFSLQLSQKIANQEVYLELVSVDPNTGLVDVTTPNLAAWKISGNDNLTNDYAVYSVQAMGIAKLDSAAVDTNAPQTGAYALFEIEPFSDECWFHCRVMDSANGRSYSNVRHQNIPNPNGLYKVRIRVKNSGTAPASTTNVMFQFVNVNDYAELTAEITAGRGNVAAGQAIAAAVVSVPTTNINIVSAGGTWYKDTTTNLGVSTTYTGSARTMGSTSALDYNRFRVMVNHVAGNTHGHLVFEQSDDNVTFRETHRRPVPSEATLFRTYDFPVLHRYARIKFVNGSVAQTAFYLGTALVRIDGSTDLDRNLQFLDSTSAQAISATLAGTALDLGGNHEYVFHKAAVFADQPGTLYLEQSRDGATWRTMAQVAVVANTPATVKTDILYRYARVKYVNGATANTVFELQSALTQA